MRRQNKLNLLVKQKKLAWPRKLVLLRRPDLRRNAKLKLPESLKSSKLPVKPLSRLRLPGLLQKKRPKEWLSRKKPRESLPLKKQRELQLNRRLPGSLLKKKLPELPLSRRLSVSLLSKKPKQHVLKLREQRLLPRLRLKPAVPLKKKLLSSPRMPKMLLKRPRRRNRLD